MRRWKVKFETAGGLPSSSFGVYAGQAQPPPAFKARMIAKSDSRSGGASARNRDRARI